MATTGQPKKREPRNGYPTVQDYFKYVCVADLYLAMQDLIDPAKSSVYNRKTTKHRNIRHSANVVSTFANTLSANAETFDSLICK